MTLTNEITMTSTEIAELTGKEKKHIHEAIKEQLLRQLYGIEDGRTLDHQQIQGLIIEYDIRLILLFWFFYYSLFKEICYKITQ